MASLKQRSIVLAKEGYEWLEHRLGLIKPLTAAAEHPTPANNASWMYVFGSAATVLLIFQVVTGILLALVYSPSASQAWGSLQILNHIRTPRDLITTQKTPRQCFTFAI